MIHDTFEGRLVLRPLSGLDVVSGAGQLHGPSHYWEGVYIGVDA